MIAFMKVTKGDDNFLKFGGLFDSAEKALAEADTAGDLIVIVQADDFDEFTLQ